MRVDVNVSLDIKDASSVVIETRCAAPANEASGRVTLPPPPATPPNGFPAAAPHRRHFHSRNRRPPILPRRATAAPFRATPRRSTGIYKSRRLAVYQRATNAATPGGGAAAYSASPRTRSLSRRLRLGLERALQLAQRPVLGHHERRVLPRLQLLVPPAAQSSVVCVCVLAVRILSVSGSAFLLGGCGGTGRHAASRSLLYPPPQRLFQNSR